MKSLSPANRLGLRALGLFLILFLGVWIVNLIFGVGVNTVLKVFTDSAAILTFVGSTLNFGCRLVIIVYLSALALQRLLGVDPWALMFPARPGWWRDLTFGLGLGAGVMLVIFGLEIALGWLQVDGWAWRELSVQAWLRALWMALLTNLFVAVTEETVFRGYLLTGLAAAWGRRIGLLVMAILFSLPHFLVGDARETNLLVFTLLLMIPGVVLGLAYLRSRALWLPMGIHFAWNFFQDELLNLTADSAQNVAALTRQVGPSWLVGTEYGVEVGLAGVLGMGIVLGAVWLWTRDRVPNPAWPEMPLLENILSSEEAHV